MTMQDSHIQITANGYYCSVLLTAQYLSWLGYSRSTILRANGTVPNSLRSIPSPTVEPRGRVLLTGIFIIENLQEYKRERKQKKTF